MSSRTGTGLFARFRRWLLEPDLEAPALPPVASSAIPVARAAVDRARQRYEDEVNAIERIDDTWRVDAALEDLRKAEARLRDLIEASIRIA